ncbi:hypothetical protein [Vibrio sp. SCSIO 43136]|uniref:hypothetical protein n=1 Tax=Vibrio sp. SCSIO 43136 TaxID=2819101 RepID=UPI0020756001|nr:hypothetical protein [Vibrio sp. SCSIO 43136]USD64243.1 hypothetical protein J4N39_08980 [Vibrio sp. SCSIO 43136]
MRKGFAEQVANSEQDNQIKELAKKLQQRDKRRSYSKCLEFARKKILSGGMGGLSN